MIERYFVQCHLETDITHNMTTLGPSRRISKTRSQVNNRVKIDVDINSLPPRSYDLEKSSGSVLLQVSQRTSVSMNSQRIHPTGRHRSSKNGPNSSVIDVEEIEDEVQLLSSSIGFQQARRNHSRRNRPLTIFLDEELDPHTRRSVTTEGNSGSKIVINCELYPDLQDISKGKEVVKSIPEPPKQPSFTCPICMNTMIEASSTVCGHIFCKSCIVASIKAQKKCPTCRRKLSMNNFHRVYLPNTD
ncbi:E3 ubiquitin-protein ligase BRE1-like isoform X1 [Zingiber officinale]|uniref:E3 ubiquitin-protein ligase BRE1-like isoform X1 n=2 Tax=Zingiber officinale TaxID=94328 RepID=UPI001C4C83EF|nr:E3 ubiquitin-protein ligase BRE1-like isoform X1 [Zingiber officinale]